DEGDASESVEVDGTVTESATAGAGDFSNTFSDIQKPGKAVSVQEGPVIQPGFAVTRREAMC
ncbi:MAG: hypothetical protein ABI905_09100, partial [Betaproteobacteria bacterium]